MNKEEIDEFNETRKLVFEVLNSNLGSKNLLDLNYFKENLKQILLNPLNLDGNICQLKQLVDEKGDNDPNLTSFWNRIETIIDEYYTHFKIQKSPFFKGKIREYEKQLVKFLVEIAKKRGTRESLSEIIAYLVIHDAITQSELKILSGMSKGAISTNLKLLEKIGFVEKTLIKGTREYKYHIGGNVQSIASNVSFIKRETSKELINFIEKTIIQINKIRSTKIQSKKLLINRLKDLKEFMHMYQSIIRKLMSSGLMKELIETGKNE